ncbi:MAG: glycosyltransferase [Rhodospirillales bacterium]|nr:glycosyltransferase [Rhodospirillales bacterium]
MTAPTPPAPRISIVLAARNCAQIIGGTLDSLRAQSFRDFEIVAVDGASTDGTTEILRDAQRDLPVKLVSEPDRSVSHALSKGLARATGDILGILCADERYYPSTLASAARWFDETPDAAVFTGRLDFMDEHEIVTDSFDAAPFDSQAVLECALVPSISATFFNRRLIGPELRYDPDIPTCCDYELWSRLGYLFPAEAFRRVDASVAKAFRGQVSMSFRPESFAAFTRDKLAHLETVLARFVPEAARDRVRRRAAAGIHLWAAEQLRTLDPAHPDILAQCQAAAALDPGNDRIARFVATHGKLRYDAATSTVTRFAPDRPGPAARSVPIKLTLGFDRNQPGVRPVSGNPPTLRTADAPWGFSYTLRAAPRDGAEEGQRWMALEAEVLQGAVGIAEFDGKDLRGERVLRGEDGRVRVTIPLDPAWPPVVMLRSAGIGGSVIALHGTELLIDPA